MEKLGEGEENLVDVNVLDMNREENREALHSYMIIDTRCVVNILF